MKRTRAHSIVILLLLSGLLGCRHSLTLPSESSSPTAAEIFGNPKYPAFSYGGYRERSRETVPTVAQLKDDMRILFAMGTRLLRTYNTQQYAHAARLLEAIRELKEEDPAFEMYVMLGAWIECEGAWTDHLNHHAGNVENNRAEMWAAVEMAQAYPDIVKAIAVGNEAMVQWAVRYFVHPGVILEWVNYLTELRERGELPPGLWITSSDNFESWGGGAPHYRTAELEALIRAVDFISVHTYPFHDSHYNPNFWGVPDEEAGLAELEKIDAAMRRARDYAIAQTQAVADYVESLGLSTPIHIGETGWATIAASSYGPTGSHAADEYKAKLYYDHMREWTEAAGMSCFYFEAFDEQWKDKGDPLGSENHFGLINLQAEAKYALWDRVDAGVFDGLARDGKPITKTYGGDRAAMMADVLVPPSVSEMGLLETTTTHPFRKPGEPVTEPAYVVVDPRLVPDATNGATYPSTKLKANAWEGTCRIELSREGVVEITTGTGAWWGCALEFPSGGPGEDLSAFAGGTLQFEIRGTTAAPFELGLQTGSYAAGTQAEHYIAFGPGTDRAISADWQHFSIPIAELTNGASLVDVTGILVLRGNTDLDGESIFLRHIVYTRD